MFFRKRTNHNRELFKLIVLVVTFLIGLLLIFNQQIQDVFISSTSYYETQKLGKSTSHVSPSFKFTNVKKISPSTLGIGLLKERTNVVGVISIPKIKMKLPIYEGLNNTNLLSGAGTMRPKQKMGKGNYALAGHHMTNPHILFSPLQNIKVGNTIYLISKSKKVYSYRVTQKKIISKYQINYIKNVSKKRIITLITCASGKPEESRRIMVRGILNQGKGR